MGEISRAFNLHIPYLESDDFVPVIMQILSAFHDNHLNKNNINIEVDCGFYKFQPLLLSKVDEVNVRRAMFSGKDYPSGHVSSLYCDFRTIRVQNVEEILTYIKLSVPDFVHLSTERYNARDFRYPLIG